MNNLTLKMVMDYAKANELWWVNTEKLEVTNIRLMGDCVMLDIRHSDYYNEVIDLELLELLAWVYSNVTV